MEKVWVGRKESCGFSTINPPNCQLLSFSLQYIFLLLFFPKGWGRRSRPPIPLHFCSSRFQTLWRAASFSILPLKQKLCSAVIWQKRAVSIQGATAERSLVKYTWKLKYSLLKVCLWLAAILAINIWSVQALRNGSEIGTPGLSLKALSISTSSSMKGESSP